jgi:hypothetical protein
MPLERLTFLAQTCYVLNACHVLQQWAGIWLFVLDPTAGILVCFGGQ